jgi:hypothetical protein
METNQSPSILTMRSQRRVIIGIDLVAFVVTPLGIVSPAVTVIATAMEVFTSGKATTTLTVLFYQY